MGRSSVADPERGLWERSNFKEVPQFLKGNRISLAYGLTSNKDQTFMEKVVLFSSYIGNMSILCDFRALWVAWPRLTPLDPALKVMLPRPRLIRICVHIHPEFKTRCLHRLFPKKMHANSSLHRLIISQIQTKCSGVGVETVWSTPSPTPTPCSLPRLRATPTPIPTPTPVPTPHPRPKA